MLKPNERPLESGDRERDAGGFIGPRIDPLYRLIRQATDERDRIACLAKLHRSTESELRNAKVFLKASLESCTLDQKNLANGITVSLPYYIAFSNGVGSSNASQTQSVFLPRNTFELLHLADPIRFKKQPDSSLKESIESLSNGAFKHVEIKWHQAGSLDGCSLRTFADLAAIMATLLEISPIPQTSTSPMIYWRLSKLFLKDKASDDQIFETAVLAWCEYIQRMAISESSVPAKAPHFGRETLRGLEAPKNPRARSLSSIEMEREFSNRFNGDDPRIQYERLLAQEVFKDSLSLLRLGCPLEIPEDGDGLLKPFCITEKRISGVTREPYLYTKVGWIRTQGPFLDTLFLVRFHSLHTSNASWKCPTMRVLRVVPDRILDRNIEPRQYLLDDSLLGVTEAIKTLSLTPSVIDDASGNSWISMRHLEDATRVAKVNAKSNEAVRTLLAATHFPYFTKKFFNVPCAV